MKWNWACWRCCTASVFYSDVNKFTFAGQLFSDGGLWEAFRWWTRWDKSLGAPVEKPKGWKCISSFSLAGRTFTTFLLTCEGAQTCTLQRCQAGVFLLKLPPDFRVSGPLAKVICDSSTSKRSATITIADMAASLLQAPERRPLLHWNGCLPLVLVAPWCKKRDRVSSVMFIETAIPTEGAHLKVRLRLSAELRLAASLVVRTSLVETQSCSTADWWLCGGRSSGRRVA